MRSPAGRTRHAPSIFRWVCTVTPPSTRMSRCLPHATRPRSPGGPVRSVVAYRGTRKSLRVSTRPASASCSRRAVMPDDISLGHGRSARSGWARRLPASAKTTWHPTEYAPTVDQHLQPTAPNLSKCVNRAKLISLVRRGCGFHAYLLA